MGKMSLLLSDVSVAYGKQGVLSNINLHVKKGEFLCIVGTSGSGKTTLLNAIAGFLPFDGTISTFGKVGVVFQQYALFPWLTVRGNVAFGVKKKKNERERFVEHYLRMVGLSSKKNVYPDALSGGEQQRVALARTLAAQPDLILMDEPYGALDMYTRNRMQEWLLSIWSKEKKTVVFVTHSLEEALFLGDRVVVLEEGNIKKEFVVPFTRPRSGDVKFLKSFVELKRRVEGYFSL